jgi:hypothetical protein
MSRRLRTLAAALAGLLLSGACSTKTQPVSQPSNDPTAARASARSAPAAPPKVIERARKALADAGITADLRLVSSEPKEWPDSSLGCPKPGMQYLQVITSGHALRFTDDGGTHAVNVAGDAAVVCSTPLAIGAPKQPEQAYRVQDLQRLIESARNDLATRLGMPVEDIRISEFERRVWPDAQLGCVTFNRGEGNTREGGAVPGFKLFLTARGKPYTYHTDSTRAIACPPIEAM